MEDKFARKQVPFWILTFTAWIVLTWPVLLQDGMFMDAMLYTSVAHNQSMGIGTFWFPQFSKLNLDLPGIHSFHEQPPLAFWIESIWFRIFGDSMYVERGYVAFTTVLTGTFIHVIWRFLFAKDQRLKLLSWLPVFLWITIPLVFWSGANNVNENTMGVFTIGAVWLFLKAQTARRGGLWWLLAGAAAVVLATLSKGFPGLFPLCVPMVFGLVRREPGALRRSLWHTVVALAVVAGVYALLFMSGDSKESLSIYLFKRALFRISEQPTTDHRFKTLKDLFQNLLPQLGFLLLVLLPRSSRQAFKLANKESNKLWRPMVLFLLIGFSASLPLMATMVQKSFYMLPCFPYFAVALAVPAAPAIVRFIESRKLSAGGVTFRIVAGCLLVGAIVFSASKIGGVSRDADRLHDLALFRQVVPRFAEVGVSSELFFRDWELQCYWMRYRNVSLDFHQDLRLRFYLLEQGAAPDRDLSDYRLLHLPTKRYDLYERIDGD